MKKLVASLFLAGLVSAPAFAQNSPVYAGAQLGDGYIGVLGGVQVSEAWGVEGHYNKIDTGPDIYGDVEAHSLGVAAVYTHKLQLNEMPGLSLFANVGVDRHSSKSGGQSYSDTELTLGGGLQYDFTPKFRARLGIDIEGPSDSLYVAGIFKF